MDRLRVRFRQYLEGVSRERASRLNPHIVAQELDESVSQIVALLESEVRDGFLSRRFRWLCPVKDAGIRWFDQDEELPEQIQCDICDTGPHTFDPDYIEVQYRLAEPQGLAQR